MTLRFALALLLMIAGFVALFRIAEARRNLDDAILALLSRTSPAEVFR